MITALHSHEAERALLGGILQRPDLLPSLRHVHQEQFNRPDHGEIWSLFGRMFAEGRPIDMLTVPRAVMSSKRSERYGEIGYIVDLESMCPSTANLGHYADVIQDCYATRLRAKAGDLLHRFPGDQDKVTKALAILDASKCVRDASMSTWHSSGDVMRAAMAGIEQDADLQREGSLGIPWGIPGLDLRMSMRPGEMTVVGARPAMGKTALTIPALKGCIGMTGSKPRACGVVSLEMRCDELGTRLALEHGLVNYGTIRHNPAGLSAGEWERLLDAGEAYDHERDGGIGPWWVDDRPGLTASEVVANCTRLHASTEGGLGLIIIDYLTLLAFEGPDSHNRTLAVGEASKAFKNMAKTLGCHVLLLAQLNRACESRDKKRPDRTSDLRDSGQIEQDADNIGFIWRECVYDEQALPEDAEMIVVKARKGETGTVLLRFQGQFQRFSERVS